jgi:predicted transglutaminase-like cysteine proteinase
MRKGWPSSALLIALARAHDQQHALLIVRTTDGDFALDNLRDKIVGWDRTGYLFEKVQSPREIWTWHRL